MPVPHHRKKHKHFQPPPRKDQPAKKGTPTSTAFAITGGVIGLVIGYLATGNIIWAIAGLLIVAAVGYLFGRNIDKSGEKK